MLDEHGHVIPDITSTFGPIDRFNMVPGAGIAGTYKGIQAIAALKETNPKDAVGDKKVPLWLLSPLAKAEWAQAQFVGQVKYGAWNWRVAGVRASTYLSAMERHMDAYKSGENSDPTDATSHLGNIMACAAILIDAIASNKLTDDRPPSISIRPTYEKVETEMVATRTRYLTMQPYHYTIADTGK